jgi:flavin reductase (DIM6/NTAB) family NADH-FMN oxidoreductase RutF
MQSFVKPPRVKESAFSMECEVNTLSPYLHSNQLTTACFVQLYQQIPISTGPSPSENTTILILGLIKRFHIRKDVLTPARDNQGPGLIDPIKLRAVSRLGGITYARIGEAFEVKRPKWKNEEEEYNKLEKEGRGSKL